MAFRVAGAKKEVTDRRSQDSGPGRGAGLEVNGPAEHRPGPGTGAAAAECQGQVVDRLLDVQAGTEWLLRKILYIIRKLGFKDLLARKKRCNSEELQVVAT